MQLMKLKRKEMREEDLCSTDGEDLALFKDMRAKERDDFLHRLSDDSDESISIKLGSFSSFKFEVSEKHEDLLDADRGKTDYNWLLTPPATPLFSKLDKETPNVERFDNSILQSKPRNIPTIQRTESSTKRAQTSSSPQRSSPVSSSCSITNYGRSRACSTPSSSGNFNTYHSTCPARSSTGTVYSSTVSARSSTNSMFSTTSFQRSSTGSSSSSSLGAKGTPSLQQKNCRISSLPQRQARQSIIPVFSCQPPQNSCPKTSELNPLHKKGSPPASRCRGETGKKSRRQAISPTFSRTGSSSKNNEGHSNIFPSKETTSSNSDFMKDLRLKTKKSSYTSSRTESPSKGSGRLDSAPNILDANLSKKSPNSRTQQRNLRQNSQSMFRPLLSDAPVTSFYAKKASPLPCQTKSYAPSISTSGNGIYEHGCIARINEVTSEGKNIRNKSSKCSISHEQENFQASEKMEIKSQDGGASLGICNRQHSNHHVSHEHGVISESECQCPNCNDICSKLKLCELATDSTNDGKHGTLLLDREAECLTSLHNCHFKSCQNVDNEHSEQIYQEDRSLKGRILTLDHQRQEVTSNNFDHVLCSYTPVGRDISEDIYQKQGVEKCNDVSRDNIDSFQLSPRKNNGNMRENELAASIDTVGNEISFRWSCNDLDKDENSLLSKFNNSDSHKLKNWVLSQGNISNLDLEKLASKTNLKVASGVLATAAEISGIYKAEYSGKDATFEGPVDLFSVIVSDKCSLKSKASAAAATEIEVQTNAHKSEGSETYSVKNSTHMPRESLMTSQKDDKPIKQIALESVNQEANWLSKEVSSLETEDQNYGCIKSPELLKNSGCFLYEKVRDDKTTQPFLGSSMQGKELEESVRNSVASEIGDLLQASRDVVHIEESDANDCKYDSFVNFETDSIPVTVNPSNLDTNMVHPASASLEGDKNNDGNATTVPASVKAQDVGVYQGDDAVPTNGRKRCLSRNMTLDEATDTVLFCSSIVHDLVYGSTMIAMQKDIPQVTPIPATPIPAIITMVGTSRGKHRNSCRGAAAQRMLTYKAINSRQTVAHLHTPSTRIQTTVEDQQPVMHVSIRERNKAPMPKKVDSKCCCSIL